MRGGFATVTTTTACQATRVPGGGDWRAIRVQVEFEAPGPWVRRTSSRERASATARALVSPTRSGTRRLGCGTTKAVVIVIVACQATRVPGGGDWRDGDDPLAVRAAGTHGREEELGRLHRGVDLGLREPDQARHLARRVTGASDVVSVTVERRGTRVPAPGSSWDTDDPASTIRAAGTLGLEEELGRPASTA